MAGIDEYVLAVSDITGEVPGESGAEGLIDRLPGARGPHPDRLSEQVAAAILTPCLGSSGPRRPLPVTVDVERRTLRVYAEAVS